LFGAAAQHRLGLRLLVEADVDLRERRVGGRSPSRHAAATASVLLHRGFSLSCLGRRISDIAAHLVDDVLLEVPVRQWPRSKSNGLRNLQRHLW
jgi:hypothetical protein